MQRMPIINEALYGRKYRANLRRSSIAKRAKDESLQKYESSMMRDFALGRQKGRLLMVLQRID
jgi:hypothetical protein